MTRQADRLIIMLARMLVGLAVWWLTTPAWAQSAMPPAMATSQAEVEATSHDEAPVVVLNRQVAVLRAPFLGMPPATRAWRNQLT